MKWCFVEEKVLFELVSHILFMNGAIVECPIPAWKVQVQVSGKSIFTIKFLNQVEALKVQGWHKYVLHCCTSGKVYATGNA